MSKLDVKGQDLELLPVGFGRRMCPAHGLGLKMVQLLPANLLYGYAVEAPRRRGGAGPEHGEVWDRYVPQGATPGYP